MIDPIELLTDTDLDAHSSAFLTYNLDLCFYDHYVRRALRSARIQNQMTFCDASQYQQTLAELVHAPRCGRQYSVTPCRAPGAFHPKIYLALGAKAGRLVIGSGNLSIGGLVRNAELFGVFDHRENDDATHAAFAEVAAFVGELAARGSDALKAQWARATGGAPWLRLPTTSDGRRVLLGGPGRTPLLEQIAALLDGRTVRNLIVCSASFDRSLDGLRSLAALTERRSLTCIVQPETVRLDGAAIRSLGKVVDWRPFVDPYPAEKKQRRDVRAHDKLFVFDCGDEELVFFGSANASAPALTSSDGNVEVLVALPWCPSGTTVKELGLGDSLSGKTVAGALAKKSWDDDGDVDDAPSWPLELTSALVRANAISLTFSRPPSKREVATLQLELAPSVGRPPIVCIALSTASDGLIAESGVLDPSIRCARIVGADGTPRSNYVALTWPEVATAGTASSIGTRYASAVAGMHDGMVLGTILFEILDRFRDFEVVFAHGGGGRVRADDAQAAAGGDTRPAEAFYTDALPGAHDPARWLGDRADLDIVAALIQPLTPAAAAEDGDDDADDAAISEEQERRAIDKKKGAATGDERADGGTATAKALERASRRLVHRLGRAATAIEAALQAKSENKLKEVSLSSLARQVWMTHIAAFLAGRTVSSSDGEEVFCLEAADFAEYVLRICRALAGGKAGGLLSLLPDSAWHGSDGEHVRRGLAFVETCCIWAVSWVRDYWEDCDDPEICADGIWDAAPELIGARLLNALRGRTAGADMEDLERRLPIADGDTASLSVWRSRLEVIAAGIRDAEAVAPPKSLPGVRRQAGDIVMNAHVGLSLVSGTDGQKVHLLDLSKGLDGRRTYQNTFVASVADPRLAGLKWRPIYDGE